MNSGAAALASNHTVPWSAWSGPLRVAARVVAGGSCRFSRMSAPPLNVFSHRIAPALVAEVLRSFGAVTLHGDDDSWTRATVSLKTGWLRRAAVVVTHNVDYYAGPGWPQQVLGMRGYFARLRRDPEVEGVIGGLRFAVAVLEASEASAKDDPRMPLVVALAKALDGVVFAPGYLFDDALRVLVGPDGERDPEAVAPRYPTSIFAATQASAGHDHRLDEDGDDEAEEPRPPSPQRVARRALVLAATTARALTEDDPPDDLPEFRRDLWNWVERCGLVDECEPHEAAFLQLQKRPSDRDIVNATWRVEGLGILMWALGRAKLRSYDTLVTPRELWKAADLFCATEEAASFVSNAALRSAQELDVTNIHLLAFHWRMKDFRLRPAAMDFVGFSKNCWFGSFPLDGFEVIDGDLALEGERIDRAPPETVDRATSTALERHLASNWLLGYSDVYSETDVST
jgi:hypothetical protein